MSDTSFAALGVPNRITTVLDREGKTHAFPIQVNTLPDTLSGRDVLGRGRTGSGKTLAFSIPMAARLGKEGGRARPGKPRGLILAPTRELATQIDAVIAPLAAAYGLTTTTIFGGVKQHRQEVALRRGADIVVACPGRLEDLMKQGHISLDAVEITVLDEADHMADLGFLPGVTRIMNATRTTGQRLLFSATLDNGVDKLVRRFLSDPVTHSVDSAESPVEAMTHHVFHVSSAEDKKDVVQALASGTGRRILFMRTKHHAKRLAKQLSASGIPAVDLHGNLSQAARDRNLAMFAEGSHRVLVATDVAARGVHVDGIELVVHVDPPAEHKAYLHRSGRTARAGSAGDVATLVLPEQRRDADQLLRKAKISVAPQKVTATADAVVELVGEVAPYVKPSAAVANAAKRNGRGPSSGGGSGRGGHSRGGQRSGGQARDGQRSGGQTRGGGSGRGGESGGDQMRGGASRGGSGAGGSSRAGSNRGGQRYASAGAGGRSGGTRSGGQRSGGARSGSQRSGGQRANRSGASAR